MNMRKNLLCDQRGAVFLWLAFALIPLLSITGLAVDGSRVYLSQRSLQSAADAAVLGAALGEEDKHIENARAFAAANLPPSFPFDPQADTELSIDGSALTVTLKSAFAPSLLKLIGFSELTITASSTALRKDTINIDVELTLVLDNSGSMLNHNRLGLLKTAAKNMVDTLLDGETEHELLRVSIVPFSGQVNVGRDNLSFVNLSDIKNLNYEFSAREIFCPSLDPSQACSVADDDSSFCTAAGYVDNPQQTIYWDRYSNGCYLGQRSVPSGVARSICSENFPYDQSEIGRIDFGLWSSRYNRCVYANGWGGCVFARAGGEDITDTPPSEAIFKPFYATTGNHNVFFEESDVNVPLHPGNYGWGPNRFCVAEMQTFLSRRNEIRSAINTLFATGPTHINQGLVWGWRTLSPRWRGVFPSDSSRPLAYNPGRGLKILVLLSDGGNYINPTYATAYGLGAEQQTANLGLSVSASNDQQVQELNSRTNTICQSLAENGVLVYSIILGLGPDEQVARDLMRNCASSSELFFDIAQAQELDGIFQNIAIDIIEESQVRLVR